MFKALQAIGTIVFVTLMSMAVMAGDYSDRSERAAVLDRVVAEGVDRDWAAAVLNDAKRQQSIIDAISRPAEKTKPWFEYRKIFLTERRAREGAEFLELHGATLAAVSAETGVPASVITAIIGVETFYGRIAGSYRVVDALSTLAFDYPRRSPFFTAELEHFLILAYESGRDPLQLHGSYAGAMGYGQFMPSSYRSYAKDYDGDGVADIWASPDDAIASVANYFVRHGWRPGAPVVVPANNDGAPETLFEGGLKPEHSVGELAGQGFAPTTATDVTLMATPLRLEGADGPEYWLCLDNFYVITRYNHSAMYALSVWQLSQEIEALANGDA
jgi:membrane-bound lytic murein transglycosylase B